MKPVSEWDEEYILSLPVGEFDWLEAKGRRSLDLTLAAVTENAVLETISKEVSAFANSGGGTLVYGLTDPEPGETEWNVDDGGVDVMIKKNGTKEWLETVIPNQMEPPLEKFNVYAIPPSSPNTKIQQGRALFVVEVPDSPKAPHQAKDYRYYSRVASRAQPIRHRQVLDILNRQQHPELGLRFRLKLRGKKADSEGQGERSTHPATVEEAILSAFDTERLFADIPALEVAVINNGRTYAQYFTLTIHVPIDLSPEKVVISKVTFRQPSVKRSLYDREYHRYMASNYGPGATGPVLPTLGQKFYFPMRPSIFNEAGIAANGIIIWVLQSDNSPVKEGFIMLSEIQVDDERV